MTGILNLRNGQHTDHDDGDTNVSDDHTIVGEEIQEHGEDRPNDGPVPHPDVSTVLSKSNDRRDNGGTPDLAQPGNERNQHGSFNATFVVSKHCQGRVVKEDRDESGNDEGRALNQNQREDGQELTQSTKQEADGHGIRRTETVGSGTVDPGNGTRQ